MEMIQSGCVAVIDFLMETTRSRHWMKGAARDLTNYQWRVVSNAIARCSLPIFVKLVFAEICRWKSYSRAQETHLASNVMDSIMMLFERIEIQVLDTLLHKPSTRLKMKGTAGRPRTKGLPYPQIRIT